MPAAEDTDPIRRPQGSVFDFLSKHQMPVLVVCVVIMGGFGVLSLFGDLFSSGGGVPVVEEGRFQVPGGSVVTLTNMQFQPRMQRVNNALANSMASRFQGRRVEASMNAWLLRVTARDEIELAWAWEILRECARAAGITITDEVIVNAIRKVNPGKDFTLRDYQRLTTESDREIERDTTAAQRFRMEIDKVQPEATWDQIFERYKATYGDSRATFVLFVTTTADIAMDPKNKLDDRVALAQWLQEHPEVRALKTIPEELDAKVLYARFKDETDEALTKQFNDRWAALVKDLKIEEPTEEALRIRFALYRPAYEAPLKVLADKFAKEAASRDSRPVDKPDEFLALKPRLRIEYLATRLVEKAFEEVARAENPMSVEDAMSKYGLKLGEVSHMTSEAIQRQVDFGTPRGASAMFQELRERSLKPGSVYKYSGDPSLAKGAIEEPGSSVAIWKIGAYRHQREATLDDPGAMDQFTEEYKKKKRQDLAKERAEEFRKTVDERVTAALAEKTAAAEAGAKAAIDQQLAAQHLDRAKAEDKPKIIEIENAEKAKKDAAIDAEKAATEPNIFLALATERFLTPRDTGWISKTGGRNSTFAPSDKLTPAEIAEQFFRKATRRTALAALNPGRMGAVEHEPGWNAAAVPLLREKREPAPEDLYRLGKAQLDQIKQQIIPVQQQQSASFWTYENFKKPEWFNLNVPSLEKSIDARREADKAAAEKKRLQDDQKKKKGKVRAEKSALDAMQSRPLYSGEDW